MDVNKALIEQGLLGQNLPYLVNGVHVTKKGMKDILNEALISMEECYMNY